MGRSVAAPPNRRDVTLYVAGAAAKGASTSTVTHTLTATARQVGQLLLFECTNHCSMHALWLAIGETVILLTLSLHPC